MQKTAIATALALALGSAALTAEAGTTGITGVYSGTYSFAMFDPAGSPVGTATAPQAWTFDFDAGTVSITNTTTFYTSVWTAQNVTFNDNGDGTYGNPVDVTNPAVPVGTPNMFFDWSVNTDLPVSELWDITDVGGGDLTVDVVSARLLGTSAAFPGFQPQFSGTLSAVPVPAAAWLFGSGLLGLVGIARRRKGQ